MSGARYSYDRHLYRSSEQDYWRMLAIEQEAAIHEVVLATGHDFFRVRKVMIKLSTSSIHSFVDSRDRAIAVMNHKTASDIDQMLEERIDWWDVL